jgi:hypothetical protein
VLRNQIKKEKRKVRKNDYQGYLYKNLTQLSRYILWPVNGAIKFNDQNCQYSRSFNIPHFNNRKQETMNNVSSIDFAMRDWCDDSDLLLVRACMEFPRISNSYKSKAKD